MAAKKKKLTPAQERERKSKIVLGALGVLLLALVAFQLPKLLGGKKSPPSAAPATVTTTGATPASSSVPVVALEGSLTSFRRFSVKDPFRAQVKPTATGATKGAASAGAGKKADAKPVTFSVQPTTTVAKGPMVPAVVLTLNGVRRVITVGAGFPADDPVFKLVSVGRKAMWISLIGGSFSGGTQMLMVERGHPIKLVNTTADDSYLIRLLRVTTAPPPPPTTTAATTTGATTTAATTTGATTTGLTTTTGAPTTTTTPSTGTTDSGP